MPRTLKAQLVPSGVWSRFGKTSVFVCVCVCDEDADTECVCVCVCENMSVCAVAGYGEIT